MLFLKINPIVFIVSFIIGLIFCYIMDPSRQIIVKFPSPLNANNVIYNGENGECYKFNAVASECPINQKLIKKQPPIV